MVYFHLLWKTFLYYGGVQNSNDNRKIVRYELEKISTKAAIYRCCSRWVFLNILQYSQENTYVGISF